MAQSELRLLKQAAIHWPKTEVNRIPDYTRGVYFLYNQNSIHMNVVYVGIARGKNTGVKGRIKTHSRNKKNWTHFSVYEVHDNVTAAEIQEIEALFLTAYAKDEHANSLNVQRGNRKLKNIRETTNKAWR